MWFPSARPAIHYMDSIVDSTAQRKQWQDDSWLRVSLSLTLLLEKRDSGQITRSMVQKKEQRGCYIFLFDATSLGHQGPLFVCRGHTNSPKSSLAYILLSYSKTHNLRLESTRTITMTSRMVAHGSQRWSMVDHLEHWKKNRSFRSFPVEANLGRKSRLGEPVLSVLSERSPK